MRMYDLIMEKRRGRAMTEEEIRWMIGEYTREEIPDYQMAAWLMAVFFRGMSAQETAWLTHAMAESGELVDLSSIPGIKVDKHSTGGVGDKTTLITAPIVAACGVPVAKMSGRGLGHTGGTVDKLEAVPGYRTTLDKAEFCRIVREVGLSIIGQSGNIAPADKKLYALRDVTATVDQISLIASSIMSKKIAAGADAIVLDVKTGKGAFAASREEALALARAMVDIGEKVGRRTVALITDMDEPLGYGVGNALEVQEAVAALSGGGPADLRLVCLELAANMLHLAGLGEIAHCRRLAAQALDEGKALARLKAMVKAQGGDVSYLEDPRRFPQAGVVRPIVAQATGYVQALDSLAVGNAAVVLGAGRRRKEDKVDHAAGLVLHKKTGEKVERGEPWATVYAGNETLAAEGEAILQTALAIGQIQTQPPVLLHARVTVEGIEEFPKGKETQ